MYRVIDKRATGKTGRLMLLAKETGATIVCGNPGAMREKAYAYGITGVDFISYGEFEIMRTSMEYKTEFEDKEFLIDEIEIYLSKISKNIIGYSLSED